MGTKKLKILAVVIAITAAVLAALYMKKLQDEQPQYASVIEASVTIPKGTAITTDMLKSADIEVSSVAAGVVTVDAVDSLNGMYAKTDIYAGEQIIQSRLTDTAPTTKELTGNTGLDVPKGMRTFTMIVSSAAQSADNLIAPGNHVDILRYHVETKDDGKQEATEKYVADDLTVAAVDQLTEAQQQAEAQTAAQQAQQNAAAQSAADGTTSSSLSADTSSMASSTTETTSTPLSYASVTLYVTPDQAKQLTFMQNNGDTLTMTLRNDEDADNASHESFTIEGVDRL